MKSFTFRGILRAECDGGKTYFTFFTRQQTFHDELNDIDMCLETGEFPFKLKQDEVRIFDFKCTLVYYRGTWGLDDDDVWLEDTRFKQRNRYIKRFPSTPKGA